MSRTLPSASVTPDPRTSPERSSVTRIPTAGWPSAVSKTCVLSVLTPRGSPLPRPEPVELLAVHPRKLVQNALDVYPASEKCLSPANRGRTCRRLHTRDRAGDRCIKERYSCSAPEAAILRTRFATSDPVSRALVWIWSGQACGGAVAFPARLTLRSFQRWY